jgi:hypothetical protein
MRFNHMELTLPKGHLDTRLRGEISAFYGEVLTRCAPGASPIGSATIGSSSRTTTTSCRGTSPSTPST